MVLHLAVLSLALTVLALGAMAYHTIRRLSRIQESRMRGLKGFRVGMYATLAAIQAVPVCWLLSLHGPWEGTPLGAVDAEEAACLVAWLGMLGLLTAAWRRQGALPLVPPALASMCLGFAMLAADAPTLQAAHLSGHWPIDALLRLVAHSAQMVLLLTMVMGELVMTQHVGSQLRGEPDPMLTPLKPPKPGKMGATGLPEDGRSIILAPSRWRMAASAFKYVLPKDKKQRLRLFACFVLVAMERGVNLAVPVLFKQMVDSLSQVSTLQTLGADGTLHAAAARLLSSIPGLSAPAATAASATAATAATAAATAAAASAAAAVGSTAAAAAATVSFWDLFYPSVFLYVGFYFLRGGSGAEGLLANVRDLLWIPITQAQGLLANVRDLLRISITQAAYRNVSLDVFGHLLMLDHQFHLKRKTGQIMRVLDRGTSSIQDTVSIVLFNVLPQIADIVVACTYLALKMQPFAAGIVFVTVASYIPLTVIITERRGKIRKIMNTLDNAREGRATDMLLNYETVKFFCNEALELEGYDSSLRQYQGAEYWQMAFLAMLAIVQGTVVWLGLVSGLVVCVRGVADGSLTIGDTVLFVTMINQLYIPLTYFGSYYRQVRVQTQLSVG
ncbi:hypothetical protein FOA52_011549 [Chlamydomonas sp. UWO 241]|nr:hypothetical protein FOA52_011549 [Chlamydomonas sp. UWO 241]